jgi:hypothetical protein
MTSILLKTRSLLSLADIQKMYLFIKSHFLNTGQGVVARQVGDHVACLVCMLSAEFTCLDRLCLGPKTAVGNLIAGIRRVNSFKVPIFHYFTSIVLTQVVNNR